MEKKKKTAPVESVESLEVANIVAETVGNDTAKPKGKRGRPKGSKSAVVKASPKGKPGRPKGSKNKANGLKIAQKRPRGRPPGTGKKTKLAATGTGNGLREVIVKIVREEVHATLLKAFSEM